MRARCLVLLLASQSDGACCSATHLLRECLTWPVAACARACTRHRSSRVHRYLRSCAFNQRLWISPFWHDCLPRCLAAAAMERTRTWRRGMQLPTALRSLVAAQCRTTRTSLRPIASSLAEPESSTVLRTAAILAGQQGEVWPGRAVLSALLLQQRPPLGARCGLPDSA